MIGRYTRSGVAHIAIGYDHIAFIVALLLWARRFWPVAKVVTAFTVAHSITLALAVLDIVALPGSLVEPLIAASIVWVAVENFIWRDVARRWKIAFALGLVHGFGLRGGAARIRACRRTRWPWRSLSSTSGWEIGQIVIVAVAVPALALLDRLTGGERDRRIVFRGVRRHRRAGRVVARCAPVIARRPRMLRGPAGSPMVPSGSERGAVWLAHLSGGTRGRRFESARSDQRRRAGIGADGIPVT